MTDHDLKTMVSLLEERNRRLKQREHDLHEQSEELNAQKEELTAAIEELVSKNASLTDALTSLKQRNDELDQVLYRASHDLKTPVSSLYGLLAAMKSESMSPALNDIHERMHQKVDQMRDLLKSLTQLAKASFEPVQVTRFYFQDLFNEVLKDLVHLQNFKHVKISLSHDSYCQIIGDKLLIGILLQALISNAVTFRDAAELGRIIVSCQVNDTSTTVEVEDDGEGIADEVTPRIFEMFFRGSERSQGSGLGLYIVQAIVRRLNGTVWFESKNGRTVFQIRLPASGA